MDILTRKIKLKFSNFHIMKLKLLLERWELMGFINEIKQNFAKTYFYRYVTISNIQITLRLRYRRSVLGFIWTVLAPLLQYMVIGVVFWYASKSQTPNYFAYFFTGSVVFNIFALTLTRAPGVMLANEHFIKKIYLPKLIYVLNLVLYEIVNFLLSSTALLVLGLVTLQYKPSLAIFFLPVALLIIIPALIGISSFLGVAGVYFRDLNYILPPLMQAAFFLTPIAYTLDVLPERFQKVIMLNPFYYFVELIRIPVVDQTLPSLGIIMVSVFMSVTMFILGLWTIYKYDNRIVFKL